MYYQPFFDFYKGSLNIEKFRSRFLVLAFAFIISFIGIAFRLVHVSFFERNEYCHHSYYTPAEVFRVNILDRNGHILATSIPTVSAYAVPKDMLDIKEAAEKLSVAFSDIDRAKMYEKLSKSKKFVWIKRHLSPVQEQVLLSLGIPGIYFMKTERRVYPCKDLCAHVVGYTDVDNLGISGIEKTMNSYLEDSNNSSLKLSIDLRVQHVVRKELMHSIEKFGAKAAGGVVLNIRTGEVIALVSLPDFDPNLIKNAQSSENFNIMTSSALEPGSSAKIINTALALEYGKMSAGTKFDARFPIKVGRRSIDDYHGKYTFLSIEEILKYSSNIGSVKMVLNVGADKQKEFFKQLGLLDPMPFELCGMQRPIYPKNWSEISAMTISFGHGIAINPLQYAASIAGLLNDGVLLQPTLLKYHEGMLRPSRRVVTSQVSKQLCYLLRLDVLEGSNKKAEAEGYLVGGKTGTAEKTKGGKYLKKSNYSCFIGAFPMNDPQYLVYVVLDDPKGIKETFGFTTAGWNAAPTAGAIIKTAANLLGVRKYSGEEINWKMLLK